MRPSMKILLFLIPLMSVLPLSAQQPTLQYGQQLFNDPRLAGSTNSASCNSCHQDGKGLEQAAERADLADAVNYCIANPMNGKPLEHESLQMQSLMLYIRSLKR